MILLFASPSSMTQEDFEPKWFRHTPDPVYQLMHPAKCCWCLCAIPTGAAVIVVLSLLGSLSSVSGGFAALAVRNAAEDGTLRNVTTAFDLFRPQRRPQPPPAAFALPQALSDISLNLLPPFAQHATSPKRQHAPFPPQQGPSSMDDTLSQQFEHANKKAAQISRLNAYTGILEGIAQAVAAVLAIPAVFCGGTAHSLRRSSQVYFGLGFIAPVVRFIVSLVVYVSGPATILVAGIDALISFIFGVHFAGVVYQYARILHARETGGQSGDVAGADLVPPPHAGGQPNPAIPSAPGASALRIHTSGVAPASGL